MLIFQAHTARPGLFQGAWGSTSGLHACAASVLPLKHRPSPPELCFWKLNWIRNFRFWTCAAQVPCTCREERQFTSSGIYSPGLFLRAAGFKEIALGSSAQIINTQFRSQSLLWWCSLQCKRNRNPVGASLWKFSQHQHWVISQKRSWFPWTHFSVTQQQKCSFFSAPLFMITFLRLQKGLSKNVCAALSGEMGGQFPRGKIYPSGSLEFSASRKFSWVWSNRTTKKKGTKFRINMKVSKEFLNTFYCPSLQRSLGPQIVHHH